MNIIQNKRGGATKKRILSEFQKNRLIKLYNSGLSSIKLAKMTGYSFPWIVKFFHKNGVKMRGHEHKWYSIDKTFFEKIDTEEKAYILGFIYGDGNNFTKKYQVSITGLATDAQIYKDIRKAMGSNSKFAYKTNKKTKNVYLTFYLYDKKISDDLVKLGVSDNKTKTIVFPDVSIVPRYLIRHFIRGIFDSDGCFTFCKQTGRNDYMGRFFIHGTKSLCESIQKILISQLKVALTKLVEDIRCYENFRTLSFGKLEDLINLYNYIYKDATIYLQRKKRKLEKYFNIKGVKI